MGYSGDERMGLHIEEIVWKYFGKWVVDSFKMGARNTTFHLKIVFKCIYVQKKLWVLFVSKMFNYFEKQKELFKSGDII